MSDADADRVTRDEALLRLNDHLGDDVRVTVNVDLGDHWMRVTQRGVLRHWRVNNPEVRADRGGFARTTREDGVYEVGGDAEIDITDLAEARLYRNFADEPTGISFALAAGRSPAVSLTIVWEE